MSRPTPAHLRVLAAMGVIFLRTHRGSCSIGDIQAITGHRSRSTVFKHLKALERVGLVESHPGTQGTWMAVVS